MMIRSLNEILAACITRDGRNWPERTGYVDHKIKTSNHTTGACSSNSSLLECMAITSDTSRSGCRYLKAPNADNGSVSAAPFVPLCRFCFSQSLLVVGHLRNSDTSPRR